MKLRALILTIFLLPLLSIAQEPAGYYKSAACLTGQSLKSALHNIIKGHIIFPYTSPSTDTWDILKQSDKDTINPEYIILFYTGWTKNASQEYNDGKGYDREHVWALSHGIDLWGDSIGVSDERTEPGTDVHNLKPSDISVNASRGNKDFDNGGTIITDKDGVTECRADTDSWEPRDKDKGDVARILFYMAVRYEGTENEPDLELVDQVNSDKLDKPGKGFHGKLCTLLKWNKLDPVDSFEMRRNNIIYSYQNNRNPFIDYPELADSIWGKTCKVQNVVDYLKPEEIFFYPNPAYNYIYSKFTYPETVKVELFSLMGEKVLESEVTGQLKLNISDLLPGMYVLKISSKRVNFGVKMIMK